MSFATLDVESLTIRYDTRYDMILQQAAWISHRHCVYYSPAGPQCKMGYPGAPAAGFPEEMRRGVGRWRGMRSTVRAANDCWGRFAAE